MGVTHTTGPAALRLRQALEQLSKVKGQVGWFESAKYADGTPVAYVAAIQEFGDPSHNIPPRATIRPTCAAPRTVWAALAQAQARAVIRGEVSAVAMMDHIGMQAAGDISKAIATLTSPPLSEITIELRRRKRAGHAISGKTVGEAARATQAPGYQPGDAGAAENKPLVFSGILLATLTNTVEGA